MIETCGKWLWKAYYFVVAVVVLLTQCMYAIFINYMKFQQNSRHKNKSLKSNVFKTEVETVSEQHLNCWSLCWSDRISVSRSSITCSLLRPWLWELSGTASPVWETSPVGPRCRVIMLFVGPNFNYLLREPFWGSLCVFWIQCLQKMLCCSFHFKLVNYGYKSLSHFS